MPKTNIFDRFDPSDTSLEYKFAIYNYGSIVNVVKFDSYDAAQRFYYKNYFIYETAQVPYINGIRLSFFEAYDFFQGNEIGKYRNYHNLIV